MNEEYRKNFDEWALYCKSLEEQSASGFVHEQELWWCALGVNIGSEQDGKNKQFERPALILKFFDNNLVLIAPLTTKIAEYDSRINAKVSDEDCQILLDQIRTVSKKRLLRKIGRIKLTVFQKTLISVIKSLVK